MDTLVITLGNLRLLPPVKVMSRFGLVDGPGTINLTRDKMDFIKPLDSELYSYSFIVDGIKITAKQSLHYEIQPQIFYL